MESDSISNDDLLDVMEMTRKLEAFIFETLRDNELNLAMSALMSSTINSVLIQCKTLDDVIYYRNLFISIFDSSIRAIKIKED
jgi:hypothetical protein